MIKPIVTKAAIFFVTFWGFILLLLPEHSYCYPDNVRYGYSNCASCHVSPTGGGLLTPYGRGASAEFLSTWSNTNEGGLIHGAVTTPDWLLAGVEVRSLTYARDNNVYKSKGIIPMQLEGQIGVTYENKFTGVATAGLYNKDTQFQTTYILANVGEHFFVRAGRFFPAFGINTPEHTLVTRRGLGFDQGQETYNIEAGTVGELGELIVDAIIKQGIAEISSEEKGFSARAAWYAGGRSQIGVSLLAVNGTVWKRTVPGVFVTAGITKNIYILAELDREHKKPTSATDESTNENTRIVSANKVGWEFFKGVHLLGLYESSVTTEGTYDQRLWSAGPGLQWFPRPHFEILAQAQLRYDQTWSDKAGALYTIMTHYNL